MAKEPDETKWVGIRPTDPSEDIPVDVVRPTDIVSNLQMFKASYAENIAVGPVNCTVVGSQPLSIVPAGEIRVITNVVVRNATSMCDITIAATFGAVYGYMKSFYTVPIDMRMAWDCMFILEAGDRMHGLFYLGGAADSVYVYAHGYTIGLYV